MHFARTNCILPTNKTPLNVKYTQVEVKRMEKIFHGYVLTIKLD